MNFNLSIYDQTLYKNLQGLFEIKTLTEIFM